MAITFSCSCGEKLEVPETAAGREVLCAKCGKSVSAPAAPPGAVPATSESQKIEVSNEPKDLPQQRGETPPHCELVRNSDGQEYWKLTCFCGKHVRSPAKIDQPYGRCPKCGRRMKLPGYLLSKKAFLISAHPGKGPVSAPSKSPTDTGDVLPLSDAPIRISELFEKRDPDDEHTTPIAPIKASLVEEAAEGIVRGRHDDAIPYLASDDEGSKGLIASQRVGLAAAAIAANRLRRQHVDNGDGRISAWPLAGKPSRALAAFIDITLTTAIAGIVVVLASVEVLSSFFLRPEIIALLFLAAGCLNDGLIHLIWGGSLGKKLVVIVTRTTYGSELGAVHVIVRAMLKWMLIPGWVIGAVDPNERTLHDLLCGTLVLKGRAKHRS